MKNGFFWDVTLCGSRKNRRFGGTYRRLIVTASVVPISQILLTLMKEALSSSETSVLTRSTRCTIPNDAVLQCPLLFVVRNKPRNNNNAFAPSYKSNVSKVIPVTGRGGL
jgi:hypothetical protein